MASPRAFSIASKAASPDLARAFATMPTADEAAMASPRAFATVGEATSLNLARAFATAGKAAAGEGQRQPSPDLLRAFAVTPTASEATAALPRAFAATSEVTSPNLERAFAVAG
ncbi:hypothetical protein NL676_022820 [Syzygium grande]|nr:hypothetical protein NL676_022820 [Syzygium grande]